MFYNCIYTYQPLLLTVMSSGFVSSNEISNKDEKDKEWKEAYERLNKEPEEKKELEEKDNRPLAEQLYERRQQKEAEFEEKIKLSSECIYISGYGPYSSISRSV